MVNSGFNNKCVAAAMGGPKDTSEPHRQAAVQQKGGKQYERHDQQRAGPLSNVNMQANTTPLPDAVRFPQPQLVLMST